MIELEELKRQHAELRAALTSLMLFCKPKASNAVALHNAHRVLKLTEPKGKADGQL